MKREDDILKFWNEKKIFKKTLKSRAGKPFVFYDGPPFATGLPHYGHILAGTIKDVIPRFETMRGRSVRREWGWDCHGLPLENIIEQELGLKHKRDIEEFGVEKFNEAAKNAVLRYDADWREIVPRTGRFVDMEHPYKTMDASYTESVWWAFKTLYDKKLAYEGYKVMLVCPRCETTLAQSEVALGGYRDTTDISVTVKFELVDEPGTYLLAWTTTPWTLPGNTAIAVNPEIEYVKVNVLDAEERATKGTISYKKYILAKNIFDSLYQRNDKDPLKLAFGLVYAHAKKEGEETIKAPQIIDKFNGQKLVGKKYKPPFDYYCNDKNLKNRENGWKVYPADFVTTDTGTGIAHEAPAFGEEDMELAVKFNIPVIQHVGMDGRIKDEVKDFRGLYVKQKGDTQSTDIEILKHLAHSGHLFSKEKIVHPYPVCWRCDTPLINYATSSWFVKVTDIKNKLLRENKKINWVPSHMKDGRFGKWLEAARDWAISRTRFWGAPLPVWRCGECKEIKVIGSLKELQKHVHKSGNTYIAMRHGEAESNVSNHISSNSRDGVHLTERGREAARASAKALKRSGISVIYSSDFVRAKETAEIVAEEIGVPLSEIIYDKRLREINTGVFHGKDVKEYHAYFKDYREMFEKRPPEGENLSDLKRRVMEFMESVESSRSDTKILFISHEYPIWMMSSGANGFSVSEAIAAKKPEFIKTSETQEISFTLFPHNRDWELDYHRPYIDEMKLPCSCGGKMERVKDVFDCWFESGSMPYGQFHYPFENKSLFKNNFPADFIAEGLDQTRGWFYSMLVLGVALFGETPYRNVIVNGLILGEDGQKMSKKLKNYPDPMEVVEKYGADALRYYLLSSPVVCGEDIAFSEKGVGEVYRKVVSRLLNVVSFYEMYAHELRFEDSWEKSENPLDLWIMARLSELTHDITLGMERYELDIASRGIEKFIDDLSTWYLRRSRERVKGDNKEDKEFALSTTHRVLLTLSKLIAPFMPFAAEEIYQKVRERKGEESVHLEEWPRVQKVSNKSREVIENMGKVREVVSLGLEERARHGIKVRQPLRKLSTTVAFPDGYQVLVGDELNVKEIIWDKNLTATLVLDTDISPELKEEGDLRELIRNVQDLRKNEKLTPHDFAVLFVDADDSSKSFVSKFEKEIKKATMMKEIRFEKTGGEEVKIGELSFKIGIKK